MTSLSVKYLLIQGRSRQTAMVATCAPSLATSPWYLSQMKPRVLGQGCSPLQRAHRLLLALFVSASRSRMTLCGFSWPEPTCSSLCWHFERDLSFLPKQSTSWVSPYLSRCAMVPKLQVLFQVCAEHSKFL